MAGKSRYIKHVDTYGMLWDSLHTWPKNQPSDILHFSVQGKDQVNYSQGNKYFLLGKSNKQIGGNFYVTRREWESFGLPNMHFAIGDQPFQQNGSHYFGPTYATSAIGVNDWPSSSGAALPGELDALGTQCIANVLPTNPLSHLLNDIGEIYRDGLPKRPGIQLWKDKTRRAKNAGSEYLNVEFGWVPLVNGMRSFANSVRNHDALLRQYERDSGRKIKRGMHIPVDIEPISESTTFGNTPSPGLNAGFYVNGGSRKRVITFSKERRRWFKGCFTYYLPPFDPDGSNTRRNEQIMNYLFGTRVTPEVIWDLTPWTWALDWMANTGDILHNVNAFHNDGLVMQYGYMMETFIHQKVTTMSDIGFRCYPGQRFTVSAVQRTIVKQRRVATPYGFGLNPNSFSNRQWAILGALGMSGSNRDLAH